MSSSKWRFNAKWKPQLRGRLGGVSRGWRESTKCQGRKDVKRRRDDDGDDDDANLI